MYKPKHKWIITFEGSSDCTGKTTLINSFNKVTDYSHLLRDRGTLSTRAYARKFSRKIGDDFKEIEEYINKFQFHLLVYLTASKEDVVERQAIKNDGYDANDYDLDKSLFDRCLNSSKYKKVVKLNSSEMTIDEEISEILDAIKLYELAYEIEKEAEYYIERKKNVR